VSGIVFRLVSDGKRKEGRKKNFMMLPDLCLAGGKEGVSGASLVHEGGKRVSVDQLSGCAKLQRGGRGTEKGLFAEKRGRRNPTPNSFYLIRRKSQRGTSR